MQKKDVGLRIRVDRDLRETFVEACRFHGVPASEVLREFMRFYAHQANLQGDHILAPLAQGNNQS